MSGNLPGQPKGINRVANLTDMSSSFAGKNDICRLQTVFARVNIAQDRWREGFIWMVNGLVTSSTDQLRSNSRCLQCSLFFIVLKSHHRREHCTLELQG